VSVRWSAHPEDPGNLDHPEATRRTALALISVCLGFLVIQLDVTIVNVALSAIQREVGGSLAGLQRVIDAYTLALAAIMLTAGSTADRVGARRVFTGGLTAFAVGSAACAAAPSLGVLIAARPVQGLGASALLPCSLALLVHQFPDRGPGRVRSACGARWARWAWRSARCSAARWWHWSAGGRSSWSTCPSACSPCSCSGGTSPNPRSTRSGARICRACCSGRCRWPA
jgi:hypothetical protein